MVTMPRIRGLVPDLQTGRHHFKIVVVVNAQFIDHRFVKTGNGH